MLKRICRILSVISLGVPIAACAVGDEILVFENKETQAMLNFPSRNFEPLSDYTILDVTFLPIFMQHSVEDKLIFGFRAYTKEAKSQFEVTKVAVDFGEKHVSYMDLPPNFDVNAWKVDFREWIYQVVEIREYSYQELRELDFDRVPVSVDLLVRSGLEEKEGTVKFEFSVTRGRFIGPR